MYLDIPQSLLEIIDELENSQSDIEKIRPLINEIKMCIDGLSRDEVIALNVYNKTLTLDASDISTSQLKDSTKYFYDSFLSQYS